MKKTVVLLAVSVLLASCGWMPKKVIRAEIPVAAEAPQPPKVTRPELPIATINEATVDEEVIRLYAATVAALQGYAAYLECLLRGYEKGAPATCRAPSDPPKPAPAPAK